MLEDIFMMLIMFSLPLGTCFYFIYYEYRQKICKHKNIEKDFGIANFYNWHYCTDCGKLLY